MTEDRPGIAALISGSGSTMEKVARACQVGTIPLSMVCVISSDPAADGIKKAAGLGIPVEVVDETSPTFDHDILNKLKLFKPLIIAQLGWDPRTPDNVITKFPNRIFNQHMGPGGRSMMGVRRVYAYQEFCKKIGEKRPYPVFCHRVESGRGYDEGGVVHFVFEKVDLEENPREAHDRLKLVEHQVQIESYRKIAIGNFEYQSLSPLAVTPEEEELFEEIRKESIRKFPRSSL